MPVKEGYIFSGWSLNAAGTAIVTSSTEVSTAGAHTLRAVWNPVKYTVTFDPNGGSGSMGSRLQTHGIAIILPSCAFTRTGYSFLGWSADSASVQPEYRAGDPFAENRQATLYAVWKPDTYTVTLDANGGTVSPETVTVEHDGVYGDLPSPSRPGHTFTGWYYGDPSLASAVIVSRGRPLALNGDHTLTAKWKLNSYVLVFDAGREASFSIEGVRKYYGVPLTLTDEIPVWSRHVFLGWSLDRNAETPQYQPGDTFNVECEEAAMYIYAVWRDKQPEPIAAAERRTFYAGTQHDLSEVVTLGTLSPEDVTVTSDNTAVLRVRGDQLIARGEGEARLMISLVEFPETVYTVNIRVIELLDHMTLLPEGLRSVGDEAFAGTSCVAVIIPEGCETVGDGCFADCPDLVYVFIPASVRSIGTDAFAGFSGSLIIYTCSDFALEYASDMGIPCVWTDEAGSW